MALRTRSRSTCLRPVRRGSAVLISAGSHGAVVKVQNFLSGPDHTCRTAGPGIPGSAPGTQNSRRPAVSWTAGVSTNPRRRIRAGVLCLRGYGPGVGGQAGGQMGRAAVTVVRPRWPGASGDDARRTARPRSAHPRCRTSLACLPRSSGIRRGPGSSRTRPWPCAREGRAPAAVHHPARRREEGPHPGKRQHPAIPNWAGGEQLRADVPQT